MLTPVMSLLPTCMETEVGEEWRKAGEEHRDYCTEAAPAPFFVKKKSGERQIKAPGKVTRCDNNRELGGIKAFPASAED